jgi:metallophosphoesterase (TIGR00282 family)
VHILFIGDVVGKPGREAVRRLLPAYRRERPLDFVAANAENAAGGSGLTPGLAAELFAAGIDCLTMGDHVFRRREILPLLQTEERLVRPANYSARAAGKGVTLLHAAGSSAGSRSAVTGSAVGAAVAVINLVGRTFMPPADSPFEAVDRALDLLAGSAHVILVDFHAEATSEKIAMGRYLDGRVTAVIGTHTHVPTADEVVLPGGTAYITDVGMTGPHDSVIGRRTDRRSEEHTSELQSLS